MNANTKAADALAADFSILDGELDDIEDLPGFGAFVSGAYVINLAKGLVKKVVAKHPAVEMEMTMVEVKELSDPEDAALAPKVGDVCSTVFMLDNEIGRGFLKLVLKPIGEALGIKNNSDILAASKGINALVVVKKTHDDKKDRDYANLVSFAVI